MAKSYTTVLYSGTLCVYVRVRVDTLGSFPACRKDRRPEVTDTMIGTYSYDLVGGPI